VKPTASHVSSDWDKNVFQRHVASAYASESSHTERKRADVTKETVVETVVPPVPW